ncbi:MAG: thiamine pyrophosphate-dependent dehydrogenase E1 component subunit alpha [Chloroflexi bacterium]|nr:thiamine pyrophosphate-dependent dehydrogenase E1 component subunit alpha [Chloroflexota bacterium]
MSVPDKTLLGLYWTMLRIRKVQLKIAEHYHEDEMHTPVHLCIGQEAIAAGVCANLRTEDYVFSNHRGHGHYLAKGGDLNALIAELHNKEKGCSRGRGGSMHLIDTSVGLLGSSSIVGGGVPIATGAALGAVLRKSDQVSVAFLGDAATEEGIVFESISFAVLKQLPVIFVCENNFYAVYTPLNKRQSHDDIYRHFEGLSIPCFRVDGNNVLETYSIAQEAIERARSGDGPSFLECRTYRMTDHHGGESGVEVGYRTQAEVDHWSAKCPVECYERFLIEKRVLSFEDVKVVGDQIDSEIESAFEYARSSPLPDGDGVLRYVMAE